MARANELEQKLLSYLPSSNWRTYRYEGDSECVDYLAQLQCDLDETSANFVRVSWFVKTHDYSKLYVVADLYIDNELDDKRSTHFVYPLMSSNDTTKQANYSEFLERRIDVSNCSYQYIPFDFCKRTCEVLCAVVGEPKMYW